ncbi:DUF1295 domain-containing protein [Pseudonocardia sp. RS11V-5]|uniref:DUF1295 domain-containing protein n=1 Tax=Pseudonocardia terrae TaxID=2905831 RepID=UPI001E65140E|nr:DUF1295 domain-containing protein [Pseudonocardia terrae]MCE3554527.1 DUF1295 domain-containing protein [Pseudonocardia terrae]
MTRSTDFPWSAWLTNLWVSAAAVLAVMAIAFAVARVRRRHDGVDVAWGSGFVVIAVISLGLSAGEGDAWRRWLVTALTVTWGLRLAVHIARRNRGEPEDARYVALLRAAAGHPWWYAVRQVYLSQGVVMWFVSLPVQLAQYGYASGAGSIVVTVLGVLVWAVGMVFETVGDAQLAAFTADPRNRGQVLDRGLWRYTRHPNYFGDAAVWWGLALIALHHLAGLIGLLAAAALTTNLVRGTGARLLESSIGERRPGYADYARCTSRFLPLPPSKEIDA